jgi:hypothetical protein
MQLSAETSIEQLNIIKSFMENFMRLKKILDTKQHITAEKKRKRENYEIV